MNRYIEIGKEWFKKIAPILKKFILNLKGFIFKQYHRNIYTQILFTKKPSRKPMTLVIGMKAYKIFDTYLILIYIIIR